MVNINELTLEEKAALTSGADAWHLTGVESKGIPGYMITDGPHGLRKMKQSTGASGLYDAVPSTCFPPAAGLANSWNPELAREVGVAMGEECVQEKVAVILGPGVNIKRNPLGGRCFEYWSEDPVLAGRLPAALIEGVQSQGVGTSLKHFAANNQETDRMRVSARITERALREIYLAAFEYIVKHAKPWTMMCSYNQINGVFSSENQWLLTTVLRDEWGYDGIVMSDWGAVHDRAASVAAGLNLEMPPSNTDDDVVIAVREGRLDERQLDRMAQGMLDLLEKTRPAMERDYTFDVAAHHEIARRAARESIVLLKNDCGILPLAKDEKIAVIGEFARTPRYQGGGSSHINPTCMVSFLDALAERGVVADFAPGFTLDDAKQDGALTGEAVAVAQNADKVVMFLGLPDSAESEGYDRTDIDLPAKQIEVLHAVAMVNPDVVVVLCYGAVVSVRDWQSDAKGLLEAWLLGQAGGEATADVLYGDVDATGRLSETIPLDIEDNPSMVNFPGGEGYVDYGEGIFVGYRYYDSRDLEVAYPFGYGLSYTAFEIGDAKATVTGPTSATVSAVVTNIGDREGSQVVQVYVAPNHDSPAVRPCHELKAFAKVDLKPGESKTVELDLDDRAFAYWSERYEDWHVEAGDYTIEFASSSRDVNDTVSVTLDGDGKALHLTDMSTVKEWLDDPLGSAIFKARATEFEQDGSTFWPEDEVNAMFFLTVPLNSITTFVGPKGRWFKESVLADYKAALIR